MHDDVEVLNIKSQWNKKNKWNNEYIGNKSMYSVV